MIYFLTLAGILFLYMNLWFVVSLIKRRNDVADVAWGLGFVLLAWSSFFIAGHSTAVGFVVSLLVCVWGLRLALHIHIRNRGRAEDYRYLEWRSAWGKWFYVRSYAQVYLLQGFFLFLIAIPVFVINASPNISFGLFGMGGLLLWAVGFYFEAMGDWQLSRFIKNPANKGKLMTSGLWAYTRHPNYFGEVTQWWGIWLIGLLCPLGLFAVIGPITITFLILKVSGIPMLEKKMVNHPEFEAYKNRTSMFFPLPQRNIPSHG